jgi:hypothetical protein
VRVFLSDAEGHLVSVILVVKPDPSQSKVLHDVAKRVKAELVVVDSTSRAGEYVGRHVPDLILLSSFLSPRDEDTLMSRLRSLEGASHLQTVAIPQFRQSAEDQPKKSGLFRKKKKTTVDIGCDPAEFAEEIAAHLARAREIKSRPPSAEPVRNPVLAPEPVFAPEPPAAEPAPVWTRSSGAIPFIDDDASPDVDNSVTDQPPTSPSSDSWIVSDHKPSDSSAVQEGTSEWVFEPVEPSKREASVDDDDIDRLMRQLGLDVKLDDGEPATAAAAPASTDDDIFDFGRSLDQARVEAQQRKSEELERAQLNPDEIRERAIAETRAVAEREAQEKLAEARAAAEREALEKLAQARAAAEREAREAVAAARAAAEHEAREARTAEIARVQAEAEARKNAAIAEAEAKKEAAIKEARAAAEREAREARAAEIARVKAEAEARKEAAIKEARAAAEREAREARAAEIARVKAEAEARNAVAEAEARKEAAIAEARVAAEREAREALAADLVRVQAEAEQMREKAIAEAQAAAERKAREMLAAELARVRSETESTFTHALNKVKGEAEEALRLRAEAQRLKEEAQHAFAQELARVRDEVETSLASQLEAARAEADRIRAAEAQAIRERAAVEAQLKSELDRLKVTAAQARKADESEVKRAAKQIKQLEAELAAVRAESEEIEERKANELEDLRVQMTEMREAAARYAREAAAEAVAAEVARATAEAAASVSRPRPVSRPTATIAHFPTPYAMPADDEPEKDTVDAIHDYLSLWRPQPPVEPIETVSEPQAAEVEEPEETPDEAEDRPNVFANVFTNVFTVDNVRRHAKWVVPVAACLLLVSSTGTAINTVARFVKPAEKPPALTVEPVKVEEPFIEVVDKRIGRLKIDSTPAGAEAIINGQSYGRTPLSIPDLEVGTHTLVLKSGAGTTTRKFTIKPNQLTQLTEAIYSGWLAIFAPIPVSVVIDGRPVNLTEDGRIMAPPGKHIVELISDRFNYRSAQTLEVKPGETTAHTLAVPMGNVRVTAPADAVIRVDGQPHQGVPSEGLAIPIGSHEISAVHPQLGERRVAVDVRHGALTEVTLSFD